MLVPSSSKELNARHGYTARASGLVSWPISQGSGCIPPPSGACMNMFGISVCSICLVEASGLQEELLATLFLRRPSAWTLDRLVSTGLHQLVGYNVNKS
eukprot:scaffold3243_cov19-Tisochrysis_lutea.AAC.1